LPEDIWPWLMNLVLTSGVLGVVAYLLRDTVAKFLTKSVEQRFEKQMETFKAEIRGNEQELDHIRSFLTSARRERDSALQAKRFEAAETLLRARHSVSQLSMLVEYMKILNSERLLEDDDPKIIEFIETLLQPFEVDEKLKRIGAIDMTLPELYLGERTLKAFSTYRGIIIHAAAMMKMFSLPMRDKGQLINVGGLSKTVIELVPGSKEGFDKWGEGFAYHWTSYFYEDVLRSLRHEVAGTDDLPRDAKSIERLALESRQAQNNIRQSLREAGLPDSLIKKDESAAASSVVEKVIA
jgi:uncharacterized membrane protein